MSNLIKSLLSVFLIAAAFVGDVRAEPWAPPGDMRLRNDLQLLDDAGVVNLPTTTWPLSWGDINGAVVAAAHDDLTLATRLALQRVRGQAREAARIGEPFVRVHASVASNPRFIRTFENTPRADLEIGAAFTWTGERFALNLAGALVDNPVDGEYFRPDGTYVGVALGNWMLSAGWQERWWGPGRDGSLILASNARPAPGLSVQRNSATAFASKWLRWIGPWSLTSFMNLLDDERAVTDALLFGLRVSFKPIESLEIGLSRTAQWCGEGRPCDLRAFGNMLLGNDNSGVNVDPDDEPGNQLAGFDIRWALPAQIPVALYVQWIGEDGRDGKGVPGSWLRQAGAEWWGEFGQLAHRTHIEWSDTACHEGGLGFADIKPNCAYEHSIYQSGYRYRSKVIGHGGDGDTLSYSLGSTLVQSAGHSWNFLLRYMEINRAGTPNSRHSISATPQERTEFYLSHSRHTPIGRFEAGLGVRQIDDLASATSSDDVTAFLRWSTF